MKLNRRTFLIAGGVIGGGFVIGTLGAGAWINGFDRRSMQRSGLPDGDKLIADWLIIEPDGRVRVLSPHTEMGQGSQTSLLQIVLDELNADPATTTLELAPALPEFTHSNAIAGLLQESGTPAWAEGFVEKLAGRMSYLMNIQFTGGSTAISYTGWRGFRHSAACARMMLSAAGAAVLGVPVSEVTTRDSRVVHEASGQSVGYGEVAAMASSQTMPESPTYKPRAEYGFIGKAHPRIDIPDKVFGKPVYGIDVRVPGMRYAAVAPPPVAMGTVTGVTNRAEVAAMPGVEAIVIMDDAVGVVADKPWRAEWAARKLTVTADPPEGSARNDETLMARRWALLEGEMDEVATRGAGAARMSGDDVVEGRYNLPFLAHTPMEPLNATIWPEDGKIHVASGVQGMLSARVAAADALGVSMEDVVFHPKSMGGGFGRRNGLVGSGMNYVTQAARIQKQVGGAVKLIWSREAGVRMSTYRPADAALMQARLGADGKITSLHARFWAPLPIADEAIPPYDIPDISVLTGTEDPALTPGVWRSINMSQIAFFVEAFIDECAQKAGVDPVAYRRSMLSDPRAIRVLDRIAEISDWKNRPQGGDRAYGVSFIHAWHTWSAQIADVSFENGAPKVHQVWSVIDCGTAVNPGSVEAQIQGGIHYGLSAALYGQINFDEQGGIRQSNFHDYRAVSFSDAPRITVEILESPDAIVGGIGEISTPGIAPAVTNALAAITDRTRDLPIVS
ncbi:MAG: molybdopterin cofactor-binding domain-containing protein [Myxococcota bacterium]